MFQVLPRAGPSGKDRGAGTHQTVCAFFRLKQRNPQAGLFAGQFLKPVQELGLLAGALVENRVGQGKEAAARPELLE